HGLQPGDHRVCHCGHRRHGLGVWLHRDCAGDRRGRGVDQGFLFRGLHHRDLCGDGAGAHAAAPGAVWPGGCAMIAVQPPRWHKLVMVAVVAALLLVPWVPQVVYPVFVMKLLCMALFACAYSLLLGFGGMMSFGHAAFFGSAAYITG